MLWAESYQNMGEHNLYERRSRKVDRQGGQRLHFQRNERACHLDFVILVFGRFINPKRQKREKWLWKCKKETEAEITTQVIHVEPEEWHLDETLTICLFNESHLQPEV